MKKIARSLAFISCLFFYGCFILLLITDYNSRPAVMKSEKELPVQASQTIPASTSTDFLSAK